MDLQRGDEGFVRFGVFEFDRQRRELRRQGRRVHLQDKPFDLLAALIDRRGEIVTREELQRRLWPTDTFVVFDDNLNAAVRKAREALGDSADAPRFIETVPRHGYRFVAPIEHSPLPDSLPTVIRHAPASSSSRTNTAAVAVSAMLAVLLGAGWAVTRNGGSTAIDPIVRFRINAPSPSRFPPGGPRLAVSPDGRHVAFLAHLEPAVGRRVWIQSIDAPAPRPVNGSEEAFDVFWSPDSRAIAFVALGMLRTLDLAGETTVPLGPADGSSGGTWSAQAGLLITSVAAEGLVLIPPSGGEPIPVTMLDSTREERVHRFPQFLPDGRTFIYVAQSRRREWSGVYLARLGEPGRTRLLDTPYKAEFVEPDQIVFVRDGRLLAQRIDLANARLVGTPFDLGAEVFTSDTGEAWFSTSTTGVLAYAGAPPPVVNDLDWFSRDGRKLGRLSVPAKCVNVSLSPDDRRAALECRTAETAAPDIWLADLARGEATRVTSHSANDESPVWSPDGRSIAYARHRGIRDEADIYIMESTAAGDGKPLLASTGPSEHPTSWSAHANTILVEQEGNVGKQDVWLLPLAGDGRPRPWLATPASEHRARFSPDGRWIAFESDRTGRPEVYVRAVDAVDANDWPISRKGGRAPRWQRDGSELYFISEDWQMVAATADADGGWAHSTQRVLFELPSRMPAPAVPPVFDVTADGRRFLVAASPNPIADPPVTVLLNWRPSR